MSEEDSIFYYYVLCHNELNFRESECKMKIIIIKEDTYNSMSLISLKEVH